MSQDETVVGKVAAESQHELELTDCVACKDFIVGRGEPEPKARTANQLVLTLSIANKCRVDRPIRTESAASLIGHRIFTNPRNNGMGKHKDLEILSDYITSNQLSMGIMTFFANTTQKVTDVYPKVTNCSFN